MSQENVEFVWRAFEAVNRRPPDWETVNATFAPDHEFVSRLDALEGETHRGGRGYRDWLLNTQQAVQWETRLENVTEIDRDRLLVVIPTRGEGKSSGVRLAEDRMACVVTVRGGKIVRSEIYPSPEDALKAVGLEG